MLQNKLRNGFEIMVQGEAKDILKEFEDFLENKFDFKLKSSNGLITGDELTNIIISEKRFSLYAFSKGRWRRKSLAFMDGSRFRCLF
jgi:hypothetical protein